MRAREVSSVVDGTPDAAPPGMRILPTVLISACATTVQVSDRKPSRPPVQPGEVEVVPHDPPALLPWFRSWDGDAERARIGKFADVHELEAEYVDACGPGLPYRIAGSPLLRHRTTSWNTTTGVVIYLSPQAGSAERLVDDLRCHLVGMMMAPFGVDDCPFDLPGIHIDARGDATDITLLVTVKNPALIAELQNRLRAQIESSARKSHED
jgi:hypothetical protein